MKALIAMYSNEPSYLSKKRFESSIAFLTGVGLIIGHSIHTWSTITTSEIISEAVVLFGVAGYVIGQIQKEKATSTDVAIPKKEEDLNV